MLGREVDYPEQVDAGLLFPIPRHRQRETLPFEVGELPFHGADEWTAWELSWLGPRGKPEIAVARITVPADSPNLIESKSLKLYLVGYAQTRFARPSDVRARIEADLGACSGAEVTVDLTIGAAIGGLSVHALGGIELDALDIDIDVEDYGPPRPEHLHAYTDAAAIEQVLISRLFRSNCPVTGQPDWADVQVHYRGAPIDPAGLLRYLIGYRRHCDFHELCVERIYLDLLARCQPEALRVLARFTRRGGLDINPWRANDPMLAPPPGQRTPRQ